MYKDNDLGVCGGKGQQSLKLEYVGGLVFIDIIHS